MKNKLFLSALIILLLTTLQGCAVIGDIFQAGAATGIIISILVVALIIFLIVKVFGGKK